MLNIELHRQLKVISDTVAACTKCALHATRTQTVFSRGNPEASLVIIGLSPGQEEDQQGLPFVGRSGKLLDTALAEVGLDREKDVYITNLIRCRPRENRDPLSEEIGSCYPYLEEQLSLLPAKVIITLGVIAAHAITDQLKPMSQLKGKWFKFKNKDVKILPHPSWILRKGGCSSNEFLEFKSYINDIIKIIK